MSPQSATRSGFPRVIAVVAGVLMMSCLLCCGGGLFLGWWGVEQDKKKLAEANRQWDAGQKAEAVATYKALIQQDLSSVPTDAERPTVYQRVIEYDLERGDTESAKAMVERALDKNVELPSGSKALTDLVVQVRGDRKRREAEELARREADEKRKQDEREAEAKRKEEDRKNAPRISVEIVAVRIEPYRTATGVNTGMVYVDWKNTGNRPVRWLTVKIRSYASSGREVDAIPLKEVLIYSASDDQPGIAPGATYSTPDGEGKLIPPQFNKTVERVTVETVRVQEKLPPEAR
ncbi:MAG: hypothetical protein L0241_22525 [Planctomycetia bacterium]|nr:hypothetical protein [Planctomycetia bacterium]